jgi:uncharacterized protein
MACNRGQQRSDENWIGTLDNFHRANGAGVVRVLLADSMGGSMILLSLTGVLLWTELNRPKTVGAVIFIASVASMLSIAFNTMFA